MAHSELSEMRVRSAKPSAKPYKLSDGGALHLLVKSNGSKLWRFKYRVGNPAREKLLALGAYPDVGLKRAREKRDEARRLLDQGIDPGEQRKLDRAANEHTFKSIAEEWLDNQAKVLSAETIGLYRGRLTDWLYTPLGKKPIDKITAPELLAVLRSIEAQGRHETTHRVMARYSAVAKYAIATGRATRDVSRDLVGSLVPTKTKHFASIIEPKRVGELLLAIDSYIGQPTVHAALKLAPHVFVRPGELRAAEWSEIDLKACEWRIPPQKMKGGEPHIVPLSKQAVAILRELQMLTGDTRYLFPSLRSFARPISDNTVNAALRRLGYSTLEMTGHGFRSTASTLLNELGYNADWIEAQLAHKETNKVRAAYNFARHLAGRRTMMQAWSDHLDKLRAGARAAAMARAA